MTRTHASRAHVAMRVRRTAATLAVPAAFLLAAPAAGAATQLGSPNAAAEPQAYACAQCRDGRAVGFQQFALRDATVVAPEDGVLVSASAYARRIGGTEPPRIAVLRPAAEEGNAVTVAESAPLPVTSATGALQKVEGLHVPVRTGDAVGLLFTAGEVDLGVRRRPRPDGAVQLLTTPCAPCGTDGGTGTELLLDATVEPDADGDGLGDETQDPDGGGLLDDSGFDDFPVEDFGDEPVGDETPKARGRLRLLDVRRRGSRGATMVLHVPRAGRLRAAITVPDKGRRGAGEPVTILTGDMRVRHAGRVRLQLDATRHGERLLARRDRLRGKAVVSLRSRGEPRKLLKRSASL